QHVEVTERPPMSQVLSRTKGVGPER
ncbi:MAG: hypothetical protein QOD96_1827, partial [Pseudonocardiales bacterium]|nr:hypothetical protein [Pseudonocardiales bacterium]